MPKGTRELRSRIKSIRNTSKVTKAMQMVSAAKMRKAQDAALRTRGYASQALLLLTRIAEQEHGEAASYQHPLLVKGDKKKMLLIAVSSNRGLCGGLNANAIRKSADFIREQEAQGVSVDVIAVGKKINDALLKMKFNVIASYTNLGDTFGFLEVSPITRMALDSFTDGTYDRVVMCYPHFISTISQRPAIKRIMPLSKELTEFLHDVLKATESIAGQEQNTDITVPDYIFEPSPKDILDILLPRLVEMQMYQALLEANASEHSARMVAMKSATDAAKDIIDDLTLTYNQARQSAITTEISEIVGGASALEIRK